MDKAALKRRAASDLNTLIRESLLKKFEEATEQIKEAIIAEYDEELVDVVTDRNSRTNPNFYRSDFLERLDEFSYIEDDGNTITLNVPDMENFNFSGRLEVIKTIMEGTMGNYVEMDEKQYKDVFNKKPLREQSLDEYVSPKERIYIVKYTAKIKQAEQDLKIKFAPYPFSNTPPIDILEEGEEFVNKNMKRWIEDALAEAQREFVNTYKGVKL